MSDYEDDIAEGETPEPGDKKTGPKLDPSEILIRQIVDNFLQLVDVRQKQQFRIPNVVVRLDASAIVKAIKEGPSGLTVRQAASP